MNFNKANRLVHRWATLAVTLPLLIILVTGVLLLWKKEVHWVQPPTQRGTTSELAIGFDRVLEIARTVDEAEITSWDDVDRLDVRPSKGVIKVRANNRWEVQIDSSTGEVLHTAYRRSDLIESIHDGSFFHDSVKLWVFFPSSLALFAMLVTGVWMFILPYRSKRKRRARVAAMRDAGTIRP